MTIEDSIRSLAVEWSERLRRQVNQRMVEMEDDDTSHFLIYEVLGISSQEGRLIDEYQNKGRFLYRYAGAFLERAAVSCFQERYPDSKAVRIPNTQGQRPRNFEIDCLVGSDAIEVKWRDATTDGDHITKEHTRIRAVCDAGYTPIRVMFYYPNRTQAIRIQQTLQTLYRGLNGQYYHGDAAWEYVHRRTGVDLLAILKRIARDNERRD